jgi:hypothetical protein
LLLMSSGRGDDAIMDLFKNAIAATGRLTVSDRSEGADLIGKLEISRARNAKTLKVTVVNRSGYVLVQSSQTVGASGSVVDAAEALAREVAAASGGESPAPPLPIETEPRDSVVVREPLPAPRPRASKGRSEEWATQETSAAASSESKRLDLLIGLELGVGGWSADAIGIIARASTGFDFSRYAQAFTRKLDGQWQPALNLHGGMKFLQFAAVEAAVQSSLAGGSGAMLAGVRLSGYPLQAFLPERTFDLGIEIGGGYAFVAGAPYDMSGSYFTLGLTGVYPLNKWLSLQVFYRLFTPFLTRFYVDYKNHITEPVEGFTAYWHTVGVGLNFRLWSNE